MNRQKEAIFEQILLRKEGAYFRMRLNDKAKDAKNNKLYRSRVSTTIYRLIFNNYLTTT